VPERTLTWEALCNARDVGGLPLAGGGETRRRAIVRTETVGDLTAAGWEAAVAYGVTQVLDLRDPAEVRANRSLQGDSVLPGERQGDPQRDAVAAVPGVARLNVPVLGWTPELGDRLDRLSLAEPDAVAATRAVYLEMLAVGHDRYARAATAVARAPSGTLVVHCHAGKDRTGLLLALLLATAGVTAEAIADDYAESARSFEPLLARWLEGVPDERRELRRRMLSAPRAALLDVLDVLDRRHGGAAAFLRDGGTGEAELAAIRARLGA
jgi:protein-tyrosine phosphatase